MKTRIFNSRQLKEAGALIKSGGLVIFPTETVYGIGANALDSEAIKKIFAIKGRPSDNPLIVHIAKEDQINLIAEIEKDKKEIIERLISRFWPGPLTIVLRKKDIVPKEVTANLETVAIRMPDNKIALALIEDAGVPIAAPSANISGKVSGTCFKHVFSDFSGKVEGIIKSKKCQIGLESSVVDMTTEKPVLLRPGGLTFEELKEELPSLILHDKKIEQMKSPGMKYQHYSPDAKIVLFENEKEKELARYYLDLKKSGQKIKIIYPLKVKNFSRKLFQILRKCDQEKVDYILISAIDEKGIGLAVMDRLRRSAFKIIK